MDTAPAQALKRVGGIALFLLVAAGAWWLTTWLLGGPCRVPSDYPTLQAAIDDPACDAVAVAAGRYPTNLRIERGLELRGAGAGQVTLVAARADLPTVHIEMPDPRATARMEGFTVAGGGGAGPGGAGVWIGGAGRVTLEESVVTGSRRGVAVWGRAQATLLTNEITENEGEGVLAAGESRVELRSNRIRQNRGDGVRLAARSEATLTENRIEENTGDGVFVWDNARAKLERNLIRLNWWQGITVGESAQAAIHDNEIRSNGVSGVTAGRTASVTLTGNRISGNGWYGLNPVGQAQVEAHANAITENLRDGVNLEGAARLTLTENEILGNRACGVLAESGTRLRGADNRVRGNGADLCKGVPRGLRVPLTSEGRASRVTVPDDYESLQEAIDAVQPGGEVVVKAGTYEESLTIDKGVELRAEGQVILEARSDKAVVVSVLESGEATLLGVTIRGGFFGVMVHDGALTLRDSALTANRNGLIASGAARVAVERSEVSGNFTYGLTSRDRAHLRLLESTVAENGQQGLSLMDQAGAEVRKSVITANGREGISLAGGASLLLVESEISRNEGQGVSAGGTSRLELQGDTVSENGEAGLIVVEEAQAAVVDSGFLDNRFGLQVRGEAEGTLELGVIQGSLAGVQAGERGRLTLIQNEVARNSVGVQLEEQARATIRGNRLSENRVGILVAHEAQAQVETNVFVRSDLWEIAAWTGECFPSSEKVPAAFSGAIRGSGNRLERGEGDPGFERVLCGDVPRAVFDGEAEAETEGQKA